MPQPSLIVVTGTPGSGKTTLAHTLAKTIRCPAICRDEIKEGYVNSAGRVDHSDDAIGRHVYETFFSAIQFLLTHQITLVAEAAFQHKLWAPKLEELRQIAALRIIICAVDPRLARSRHIQRGLADPDRERFHDDRPVKAAREGIELPVGEYDPPRLDVPTLTVDTTDEYRPSFDTVVSFARG
jgi:predicted kinase